MKKILIVEDDAHIAELERDYLQLNGFQADIVHDGAEGLRKALDGAYSVIIVDLMLPGLDGYEVVKKIRAVKDVIILVVSAKMEEIDKIRGLEYGADDYLTKPFSPGELVARIKSHLRRYDRLKWPMGETVLIVCRGLEINTASHEVNVDGKEVQLTAKEYELLVFFASHPGIVFSKEHLLTAIWGDDSYVDTSTIAVHIQKIRKKVEKDPTNPEYIETIWGTGYRFSGK